MDIDAISATFDAILRLSRLQSGAVALSRDPVDLGALAQSVCDILQPAAEEAGHALALDAPPGPTLVEGDEGMLSQALTNLVVNAVEHCPSPATLRVSTGLQDGHPFLAVSDTGPGIPEADRGRVLDRFVRLDASRTVPGSGLGLSLVAAIAELHQARLVLEDNRPGLKVSIEFPRVPPASGDPARL
jgi:signal transduction histidine kinase